MKDIQTVLQEFAAITERHKITPKYMADTLNLVIDHLSDLINVTNFSTQQEMQRADELLSTSIASLRQECIRLIEESKDSDDSVEQFAEIINTIRDTLYPATHQQETITMDINSRHPLGDGFISNNITLQEGQSITLPATYAQGMPVGLLDESMSRLIAPSVGGGGSFTATQGMQVFLFSPTGVFPSCSFQLSTATRTDAIQALQTQVNTLDTKLDSLMAEIQSALQNIIHD